MSLQLTVDDTYDFDLTRPDGIQYSPGWMSGIDSSASSPRYNNTIHWTTTPQANFVYFFQGNAISYYGDKDVNSAPILIRFDGGVEELIDATASSTLTQQLLWSKTGLGPGDHQVIIKHNGTSSQYLRLDYLRLESDHGFTPSISGPAASNVPSEALFIDDNHSSLVYSSNWTTDSSAEYGAYYGSTLHRTNTPGDFVSFKFTGTAVWYFANTNRRHGNVEVRLDNGKAQTVSMFGDTWMQQQLMWSQTNLSDGEHTVVITHADDDGVPMTLDFFRLVGRETLGTGNSG
ncbi:hypothetical protein FRC07_013264 [Ceratobasidium sp. 392]|nr:hypothetical protein FRC07_013264 [Ceratobasidium sp. 392]